MVGQLQRLLNRQNAATGLECRWSLANDFDAGTVSGSPRQRGVPRNQRRIERFRKSKVSRVVGCQVAPERPDSKEENVVWITVQRQIGEIFECLLAPLRVHFAGEGIAPQDLRNLKIEHMRGVCRCDRTASRLPDRMPVC